MTELAHLPARTYLMRESEPVAACRFTLDGYAAATRKTNREFGTSPAEPQY